MFGREALLFLLLTAAATIGLPIEETDAGKKADSIIENGSAVPIPLTPTVATQGEKNCSQSGVQGATQLTDGAQLDCKKNNDKSDSTTSSSSTEELPTSVTSIEDFPTVASEPPTNVSSRCYENFTFTVYFKDYKEGENGEPIAFQNSREFTTSKCCEGYTGKNCELDLCANLTCHEDPEHSRCVIIARCNDTRIPIFVDGQNFLSDKCTQPKESVPYLCPGRDICSSNSTCPDSSKEGAVCMGTRCNCSAGPMWYSLQDGKEADCHS